jgi:hypothetical protein
LRASYYLYPTKIPPPHTTVPAPLLKYLNVGVSSSLLGKVNGSFPLGLATSKMTEAIAVPTSLPPNQERRSVLALQTHGMANYVPD